jgi:hypothetical protein
MAMSNAISRRATGVCISKSVHGVRGGQVVRRDLLVGIAAKAISNDLHK